MRRSSIWALLLPGLLVASCTDIFLPAKGDEGQPCFDDGTCLAGLVCGSDGKCHLAVSCQNDTDCDDGQFCNGPESCQNGHCQAGTAPCAADVCDEANDSCGGCSDDSECLDDLFCNGLESCQGGVCQAGTDPCAERGQCHEDTDSCGDCGDGQVGDGEQCDPGAPQNDNCCDSITCRWVADGLEDPQGLCPAKTDCGIHVCDGSGGCRLDPFDPGQSCDDGDDCTSDDVCDGDGKCKGSVMPPPTPVPLRPANGWRSGSVHFSDNLRPEFRWNMPADSCDGTITVEIQVDDSCLRGDFQGCAFDSPEASVTDIDGSAQSTWRPSAELAVSSTRPVGRRYYWRLRACRAGACSPWSAVRYLDVGRVASDFDGDGYSDLAVGAYEDDQIATSGVNGYVYVFAGQEAGMTSSPVRTLPNPQSGDTDFGISVAEAGDVNGDGFADLLVGAPMATDAGGNIVGWAYLYLGSGSGLRDTPNFAFWSLSAGSYFGTAVAGAGDIDADGFADFIIGASGENGTNGELSAGRAHLYYGSETQLDRAIAIENPSPNQQAYFGSAVAAAGDVDGDGFGDLVIGAMGTDGASDSQGAAFVFFGAASGIPENPVFATLVNPDATDTGLFGWVVAPAGDFNGDGYDDFVVSAPRNSGLVGNAYLFSGSPDVREEEIAYIRFSEPSGQGEARFGSWAAGAGDTNSDGYCDLVIGAWLYDDGSSQDEGAAFVFLGTSGSVDVPLPIDHPDNRVAAHFGLPAAGIGDVNGDGYADIAVGADNAQGDTASITGAAYVFMGSEDGIIQGTAVKLTNPNDTGAGRFGYALSVAATY